MMSYVQIYTGDGKGKTTAAVGLAVRAAGAGKKVFFGQFLKKGDYSEIKGLGLLGEKKPFIQQFGSGRPVTEPLNEDDNIAAERGLTVVEAEMKSGKWDIMILDEFNIVAALGLVGRERLSDFIDQRNIETELILTGRDAPSWLMEKADLISEMKMHKHYFEQGVAARRGIEF